MVFTDPGTNVLELTHSRFNGISSYDPLAQLFGVNFAILVGAAEPREGELVPKRGENNLDFHVRPDAVVGAVKTLIGAQ